MPRRTRRTAAQRRRSPRSFETGEDEAAAAAEKDAGRVATRRATRSRKATTTAKPASSKKRKRGQATKATRESERKKQQREEEVESTDENADEQDETEHASDDGHSKEKSDRDSSGAEEDGDEELSKAEGEDAAKSAPAEEETAEAKKESKSQAKPVRTSSRRRTRQKKDDSGNSSGEQAAEDSDGSGEDAADVVEDETPAKQEKKRTEDVPTRASRRNQDQKETALGGDGGDGSDSGKLHEAKSTTAKDSESVRSGEEKTEQPTQDDLTKKASTTTWAEAELGDIKMESFISQESKKGTVDEKGPALSGEPAKTIDGAGAAAKQSLDELDKTKSVSADENGARLAGNHVSLVPETTTTGESAPTESIINHSEIHTSKPSTKESGIQGAEGDGDRGKAKSQKKTESPDSEELDGRVKAEANSVKPKVESNGQKVTMDAELTVTSASSVLAKDEPHLKTDGGSNGSEPVDGCRDVGESGETAMSATGTLKTEERIGMLESKPGIARKETPQSADTDSLSVQVQPVTAKGVDRNGDVLDLIPTGSQSSTVVIADNDAVAVKTRKRPREDISSIGNGPEDVKSSLEEETESNSKRLRDDEGRKELVHLTNGGEPSAATFRKFMSVDRIKALLYSAGSLVHKGDGYERLFARYWEALSLQLEGIQTEDYRPVLNSFLKTRKLRRMHNRLILGLLQRCVQPAVPSAEISKHIPEYLSKHIKPLCSVPLQAKNEDLQQRAQNDLSRPVMPELPTGHLFPHLCSEASILPQDAHRVPHASLRVPGAVAIDPNVRMRTQSVQMRVTENAVWLLVVAAKEYAISVLARSLESARAIEAGKVPRLMSRSNGWKNVNVAPTGAGKPSLPPGETRCITASDLHRLATSSSIAAVRSLGGAVSRLSFEHNMFGSLETSLVARDTAFSEVRRHIQSELKTSIPKRRPIESPGPPGDPMRRSSKSPAPVAGMGRGAKDLAALKARSSFTMKNTTSGPAAASNSVPNASTSSASQATLPTAAPAPQPVVASDKAVPSSSATTEQKSMEGSVSSSPHTSEATQKPQTVAIARKGKGFGVKNLAAMRARSITALKPGEATTETGATDTASQSEPKDKTDGDPKDQVSAEEGITAVPEQNAAAASSHSELKGKNDGVPKDQMSAEKAETVNTDQKASGNSAADVAGAKAVEPSTIANGPSDKTQPHVPSPATAVSTTAKDGEGPQ